MNLGNDSNILSPLPESLGAVSDSNELQPNSSVPYIRQRAATFSSPSDLNMGHPSADGSKLLRKGRCTWGSEKA